ncbi:unnamed protein product [Brassica napus]|uniref:(rape) hypothetical protein n=1 Tax=Brassica napus TaxID=3708 RepID=A0A816JTB0_BRANA|nr:unnamed protein product [Brassica napus]
MASTVGQETHVLLVALPVQGHLNPMLKFAKLLSRPNLRFTLATTEQARDLLSAANTADEEHLSPVDLAFFPDGLPKDHPRADDSLLVSLRNVGAKNLSKIVESNRFSCIVTVPFAPWVPGVAAAYNIPCALLWIQACGAYSVYYRYYMATNTFPEDLEDLNQTVDLPALPLLEVRDLPSFMLPSSGKSEIIDSMSDLKPIIPIGPLVSPFLLRADEDKTLDEKNLDLWRSDGDCIKWLDTQARSSVVYISFGSLLKWSVNQVESIATAMRNRGISFLWVIRPKEMAQNVGVLQEMVQEGQGVVIEWGPQERILSHVAISCFVTHCGWNSTMETVVTGVPVVAYPSWIDQPLDARLLVDVFGIGVRMRNDEVDGQLKVAEVERCIEAVMEGPSAEDMRRRATELKQAARLALAPGGSSAQNLDSFIGYITMIPSQPQKLPRPTHVASEAENPQQPRVTSGSSTKSPSHRVDEQNDEEIRSNNRDSNAPEVAVDNDSPRTVERDDMTFGEIETGYASGGRRRDNDGDEEAEMHGDKEGDEEAEKQGLDDDEADKEGEDNGDKDGDEAEAEKDGDEVEAENDGEKQIEAEAEKDGEKQIEAEAEKLMQGKS